ncbi:putative taste receptor type 2 member 33 [Erethizon dorsatum]
MISVLQNVLTILVTAEFVVGNFANVFIALVNCTDWVKRQRISSADGILTALAVSRIGLLWIIFISWFLTLFNPALNSGIIAHISWTTVNHFSTWIATSLSIFYLLKIANFSNLIFLHLKKRVNKVIVLTLLGCSVLLLSRLVIISVYETTGLKEQEGNVTWKTEMGGTVRSSNVSVFTLIHFLPFITSIICCLLLIYSLCKHLRHMRQYNKGSQDPCTKVHVKALKTVVSYLLLFAMYSLSIIISTWSFNRPQNKSVYLLSQTIGFLYPSSHSCVLIWGNRKLKQAFVLGVWQARCWLRKKKPSSPYR